MLTEVIPGKAPPEAPTILVVDDMDEIRVLLARLLRLEGYRPVTAGDGEAALAAVEAEAPELVLLDLTMPGMDGLEVLRRLRDNPRYRALPVILFTAVDDWHCLVEARRLGVSDYVVKGTAGAADLIDCIARHRRAA